MDTRTNASRLQEGVKRVCACPRKVLMLTLSACVLRNFTPHGFLDILTQKQSEFPVHIMKLKEAIQIARAPFKEKLRPVKLPSSDRMLARAASDMLEGQRARSAGVTSAPCSRRAWANQWSGFPACIPLSFNGRRRTAKARSELPSALSGMHTLMCHKFR